jgi:rRNA maturation endonuclease Nob1
LRPSTGPWRRLAVPGDQIDLERCPNCGGQLKIIAAILDAP